ncbi:hypothetical protein DRQ09_02470 [candidate division KSB1 bacterium]|nr:MAG: hypothetical protein DRQ09_02470 [candidate division KSB1 bacterium]
MDFERTKILFEKLKSDKKNNNCLELYEEAKFKKISLFDLLEEKDPSDKDKNGNIISPLNAFERLLYLANICSDGKRRITLQDFYESPVSLLVPEWIRINVETGMKMKPEADDLCGVEVPMSGSSVTPLYITEAGDEESDLGEVTEGAEMPLINITERTKSIKARDFGRQINLSYRVLRNRDLSEVKSIFWYIGFRIQEAKIGAVYNAILDGDGVSGGAPTINIETPGGLDNLKYEDLLSVFTDLEKFEMNRIICSKNGKLAILSLPEFKDPLAGSRLQFTGEVPTPLGARIVQYGNATDSKIACFDKRFAVKKYIEQGLLIEVSKIIEQKFEKTAISESTAYSIFLKGAARVLDAS